MTRGSEAEVAKRGCVWFYTGLIALGLSIAASVVLTLEQLAGLQLPGCGPGSACSNLAAGPGGSIAGWPVSYLGLAWFVGLAVAWIVSRRGVSGNLKGAVRLGMLGSLFFSGLMWRMESLCLYCGLAHLGNLALWLAAEWAPRAVPKADHGVGRQIDWSLVAGCGALLLTIGTLAGLQSGVQRQVASEAEQQMRESVERITSGARQEGESSGGFTGRHPRGPELAPLRLVVFGGYQCPGCRRAEEELEEVLKDHGEQIRFTFRHFPMCRDCNWTILHPSFHDNACQAAWAAEAAAMLGGNEGFWRMHHWLFARDGVFTDAQLRAALPELGFEDADSFFEAMASEEVRDRVREDIEAAEALGLDGTPLFFVNGVELKGAGVSGNVTAALQDLLARDLPPRSVTDDRPPERIDRLVARWHEESALELPEEPSGWSVGPREAPHELLLPLDYGHPYTRVRDTVARQVVETRDDVRLRLVPFPMSGQFRERFASDSGDRYGPVSAEGARLAEAVWQLGGARAFKPVHVYLVEQAEDFDLVAAIAVAVEAGLDADQVRDRMASPEVEAAIDTMMTAVEEAGIRAAGHLYLDGRRVTAILPTVELIERLLDQP